jgi:NhaP-type Na+/H+ or K+/H+ antiporter
MAWPQVEPSTPHLTYLYLAFFLILYALFSELIRNRAHLAEPPLATLAGILAGPRGAGILDPISKWGWEDNITHELTRIITGVQCFAVGIALPAKYPKHHQRSIALLLGPTMTAGWITSAIIIKLVLKTSWTTALIVGACLTPTDPVLSASVIGEARFSQRVPQRIRHLLSAESGSNDGTAFPFLYAALYATIAKSTGQGVRMFITDVLLWQCLTGVVIGIVVGLAARRALRFSEERGYVQESTLFVFYFLLAVLCVGVGSTLGLDDFLVCFSAGVAFCWDGWFSSRTARMKLPSILDLMLNSTMFVYFGAMIPWPMYRDHLAPGRMLLCVVLVLILRRLPAMLALKRFIPDVKTYGEAIFAGHFGPIGVGALFLSIEARARLETGTSEPLPHPGKHSDHQEAIATVWPVVCGLVFSSIMVHGFSPLVMSIASHFMKHPKERSHLVGGDEDGLGGMLHEEEDDDGQEERTEERYVDDVDGHA